MFYLFDLIFPPLCFACESVLTQGEQGICTICRHELPQTNYHIQNPNPVERLFLGRVALKKAVSFLKFEDHNRVQHLLHELKYHGQETIGTYLGHWFGSIISECEFFDPIDGIIPVPVSKKRLKQRGYNQVLKFAQALAEKLNCPCIDTILLKSKEVTSQVKLSSSERSKVLSGTFTASTSSDFDFFSNILLVDDLITTGVTIEACANTLHEAGYHQINVASIAFRV